jgi:hypothetical protein
MWSDGDIPPAVQEIEVASDIEDGEKLKPQNDKTGPLETVVLEKKDSIREETNGTHDSAPKRCVIVMHKDLLHTSIVFPVVIGLPFFASFFF